MITDHTIKTRLLLRPVRSALGTIRIGGLNKIGVGVGVPGDPPRTLSCYGFNYVLAGRGRYVDARGREQSVYAGNVVLFFPKTAHRCCAMPGETWDELWFEFEGPVFDVLRRSKLLDPAQPVREASGVAAAWVKRFLSLMPPLHQRRAVVPEAVVSRFVALLVELLGGGGAEHEDAAQTTQADWVAKACAMLATTTETKTRTGEAAAEVDAAHVARKLGFSYENFRKKFRDAVGFSPGQYHMDARMDRATALLFEEQHSIKQIAALLGFCDEFYFSRCFKRRFGQSPRAFRQAAQRRT